MVIAGEKLTWTCHNSMGAVMKYPTPDAPEDCEKDTVCEGTERRCWAWIYRLIASRKAPFEFRQIPDTHADGTPPLSAVPAPPAHREAVIDTHGAITPDIADFTAPANGVYTVVIRTPYGPPNKQVRETLRGHGMRWNPNDGRGDRNYPAPAWLKYHVPGPELTAYRKLAAELKLDFDYLDKNPVKP
jgi:hypothetical protein